MGRQSRRGNCHDYAVTKRHELIRQGWPAASLRLAVAYTPSGIGHLVVVCPYVGGGPRPG